MPIDKEALRRSLAGADEQRLAAGITGVLSPFFDAAREGYRLAPAAGIDGREVGRIIAQATGREVLQVIFIDSLHPAHGRKQRRLFQLRSGAADDRVREDHLDEDLGQVLQAALGRTAAFCIGQDHLAEAAAALLAHLWPDLRRRLDCGSPVLRAAVRNGLWTSLLYLLGFFLIGNQSRLRRLLPLIKLMPRAVPVGTSARDPGIWYVLIAGSP